LLDSMFTLDVFHTYENFIIFGVVYGNKFA